MGRSKRCWPRPKRGGWRGQRIAAEVLEIAERLFPKVFAWQRRIQKLAHEQQFLRTQFGHVRRFYLVIDVEGAQGHTWAEMSEINVKEYL
jgi:hypothetical protein